MAAGVGRAPPPRRAPRAAAAHPARNTAIVSSSSARSSPNAGEQPPVRRSASPARAPAPGRGAGARLAAATARRRRSRPSIAASSVVRPQRLGDERVHAGREAALPIAGHGVGGDGDDRRGRARCRRSALRIAAVASKPSMPGICTSIRMTSKRPRGRQRHRLAAGGRRRHRVAALLEHVRDQRLVGGVVLDDQHVEAAAAPAGAAAPRSPGSGTGGAAVTAASTRRAAPTAAAAWSAGRR